MPSRSRSTQREAEQPVWYIADADLAADYDPGSGVVREMAYRAGDRVSPHKVAAHPEWEGLVSPEQQPPPGGTGQEPSPGSGEE